MTNTCFAEKLKPVLNRVVVELFPVGGQGHFRAHAYKTADFHSFTRNIMSSSTWVPVSSFFHIKSTVVDLF